jgi:hypothetical protein
MAWFMVECHMTPDEVYDMPWTVLVHMSLQIDKKQAQGRDHNAVVAEARASRDGQGSGMRRMGEWK